MGHPGPFRNESGAHAENLFDEKLSIAKKQGAPTYRAPRLLRGGEKTLGRAWFRLGPRVVLRAMDVVRQGHAHKQERGRQDARLDAAGFHFVPLLDLRVAISARTGPHSYPILRREMSRRYWPSVQVSRGAT